MRVKPQTPASHWQEKSRWQEQEIERLIHESKWGAQWHQLVESIATILEVNSAGGFAELAQDIPAAITQLRGNLSMAEEGLASATQELDGMTTQRDHWLEIAREKDAEIERLKLSQSEAEREMLSQSEKRRVACMVIEQQKRNLASQSKEIDAQVTEIQRLQKHKDILLQLVREGMRVGSSIKAFVEWQQKAEFILAKEPPASEPVATPWNPTTSTDASIHDQIHSCREPDCRLCAALKSGDGHVA